MRRLALLLPLALTAAAPPSANIPATSIPAANWPTYGGAGENHYSPLAQINTGNAQKLGLVWSQDITDGGSAQSAPVEVGGVLYYASGYSHIRAVEAATGRLLWHYDAQAWKVAGRKLRASWGIRGLAYDQGRIFFGTIDGRLIALDARTGKPAWSRMTVARDDERYITGAPWVFKGKVVIGHGGADFAPIRGYVTAYDQKTGKQLWRFYTVPGNPAVDHDETTRLAAKSWTGEWWKFGGGATVWNAMAYDPRFNRLYIGTGNGSPWNRKIRSPGGGDNLFVCSIVALDADTGRYVWHYQTNPGESWDYNSDMDIELTDMVVNGQKRPVLMHAPKNGFVYVIDRETGKLISARNMVPVNWAKGIDPATGRPIENPEARYPDGKPAIVYPSPFGAHNIEAMSYNPATGLLYIPGMDQGRVYVDPPGKLEDWRHMDGQRLSTGTGAPPPGVVPDRPATSFLLAWNPQTQTEAWRLPMPGIRGAGGTASTAGGLVFAGDAGGFFNAYDARTGKTLWRFDAQTAVTAQPITYSVRGRQYVSVIAGARFAAGIGLPREWNYRTQQWRLLTFALGGKAKLPAPNLDQPPLLAAPEFALDPARAALGATVFSQRCTICHGGGTVSGGTAPDLGQSPIPLDAAAFAAVLHDGALRERGMPRFEELSEAELEGLRHYIRQRARERLAAAPAPTNRGNHEGQ